MPTPGKHDFVSDGDRYRSGAFEGASSSSIDEFVMSGGLGKLTVTPSPSAKTSISRSRSRSIDTPKYDAVPKLKKSRIETLDLTSSPEAVKASAKKTKKSPKKQKSSKTQAQKKDEPKRRESTYTPPSSPPPPPTKPQEQAKPAPTFRPLRPLQEPDPIVDQQRLSGTAADQHATSAAKSTTSGSAVTSSAARLKERKRDSAQAKTNLPSSFQKQAPATVKANGVGSAAKSSAEPPHERKQQVQDKPNKSIPQGNGTTESAPVSRSDEDKGTSVRVSATTSPSAVPTSAANGGPSRINNAKQQAQPDRLPSARPTTSTTRMSQPTAPGSTSAPDAEVSNPFSTLNLPALAIELNYNKRAIAATELAKAVAEGESREQDARAKQKAARRKERQKMKNEKVKARKRVDERTPLQPVDNGSIVKPTQRGKLAKQPTVAPTRATPPAKPTQQSTIAPSKPTPPEEPTEQASTASSKPNPKPSSSQPPTTHPDPNPSLRQSTFPFPDPTQQSPHPPSTPESSSSLTPAQFSHIFHHSPAALRDKMLRLLRWAWHEGRVGKEVGMAEFFCGPWAGEERGWVVGEWGRLGGEMGRGVGGGVGDGEEGKGKEKVVSEDRAGLEERRKRRRLTVVSLPCSSCDEEEG